MAQLQNTLPLSLGANEGSERVSQRSAFTRENAASGRERDQFSDLLSQERQQSAARNSDDLKSRNNQSANNLADRNDSERRSDAQNDRRAKTERASESKHAENNKSRNRDTEPTQRQPVETKPTDDPERNANNRTENNESSGHRDSADIDVDTEAPDWLSLVAAMQAQLNNEDGEATADLKAQVDELVKEMPEDIQAQLRQLFADIDGEALVQAFNQVFAELESGASLSTEQLRAQLAQHIELPQSMSDKALAALGLLLQPGTDTNAQLQLGWNTENGKQLTALTPSDLAVQLGNIRQALGSKDGTDPSVFIGNPGVKPDAKVSGDEKAVDAKVAEALLKSADDKVGQTKLNAETVDDKTPRSTILGQATDTGKAADASKAGIANNNAEAGQNKLSREEALFAAAQANADSKSSGTVEKVAAEVGSKDLSVDASKLVSNDNRSLTQAQQAAKDAQIQVKAPTSFAEAMRQSQQSLELNSQQAPQQLRERLMFMVNNGVQRAEIRLDPPDLGSMSIRVTVQNDQAQVNFQAQNPQAREMLEQAMPRLRELMEQQGLQLADSGVSEQQQQQADGNGAGTAQGEAGSDVADEATWQSEIALDNGEPLVPGRVDFFA